MSAVDAMALDVEDVVNAVVRTDLLPGQIRLFCLQGLTNERHSYTIVDAGIFDLTSAPPYLAISYTCGPPYMSLRRSEEGNTADFINGEEVWSSDFQIGNLDPWQVPHNLKNALSQWGSAQTKACWFWADVLCISAHNATERASQIQMMSKIFSSAFEVVVWLGHDQVIPMLDLDSATALQNVLLKFVPAIQRMLAHNDPLLEGVPNVYMQTEAFAQRVGMTSYSELFRSLRTVAYLCRSCRWLHRRWCVQEVLLARRIRVLWGSLEVSWEQLGAFAVTMRDLGWDEIVAQWLSKLAPGGNMRYTLDWFGGLRTMYGSWRALRRIFKTEMLGTMPKSHLQELKVTPTASFAYCADILAQLATFDCSRPHDRIYAALGVLDLAFVDGISNYISVNYAKSFENLYTEVTASYLEATRDLDRIAHKSQEQALPSNLPSWVPDFRVSLTKKRTCVEQGFRCSAGLGQALLYQHPSPSFEVCGTVLRCYGGHFAAIEQCWGTHPQGRVLTRLDILRTMPLRLCGRRRLEVLWRTLLHNRDDATRISPKPEMEILFIDMMLCNLIEIVVRKPGFTSADVAECAVYLNDLLSDSNPDLTRPKRQDFFYSQCGLYPNPNTMDVNDPGNQQISQQEWVSQFYATPQAVSGMRFQTALSANMQYHRHLFRTDSGMLGTGPACMQEGNEVWVVRGATVSFILRPTAKDGEYEYVGDAFILDHMHGEMLKDEYGMMERLRDFTIV